MSTVITTTVGGSSPGTGSRAVTVIDVGGSHLRRARWEPTEGLTGRGQEPSPSFRRHPGATAGELRARMVDALCAAVPADGGTAGVSFGAALDARSGTVYASAPLWGAHSEPFDLLAALRARRPDVGWHVVNDVTAALLHLASAPRRKTHRKVLLATVSTGIACRTLDVRTGAIPVDGAGLQGEIGHLPATATLLGEPVELLCDCGAAGHLAAYASGPGIRNMATELRDRAGRQWSRSRLSTELDGDAAFEDAFRTALDMDDPLAGELLTAVTRPVADTLRTALCLDPEIDEAALTGGVVFGLAGHYRRALMDHLTRQGLYLTGEITPQWVEQRITVCKPGEADGLIGAGIAALAAEAALPSVPLDAQSGEGQ
ncbi:ROK family protein [Streptomyces olivoreticuli]